MQKENKEIAVKFAKDNCPYIKIMNDINYQIYSDKITFDQAKDIYDDKIDSLFKIQSKEDDILFILLNAKGLDKKNICISISYNILTNNFANSLENALFIFNYYINKRNNNEHA